MLVLTFRPGEKAITSNGIVIEVVNIRSGKVRVGFIADKSITIDRECVHKSKQRKVKVPA